MANMCDNSIVFKGDPNTIENVKALFKEIQETQEQTGKWHLPAYVTASFSYMQEIVINHDTINCQTRWHPNFEGLIQIADHFQLDFVMTYSQLTDGLRGEATYLNKAFNDMRSDRPNDTQQQIGLSR